MEPTLSAVHQEVPDILVVDDTPANLQLLTEILKKRGYRVRPVPSGKLALQAAQKEQPDLILLDINMPEMNGYEVCERLKADAVLKEIPVLFISALDETIDKIKAFAAGGVDYVTKPWRRSHSITATSGFSLNGKVGIASCRRTMISSGNWRTCGII